MQEASSDELESLCPYSLNNLIVFKKFQLYTTVFKVKVIILQEYKAKDIIFLVQCCSPMAVFSS